MLVVIAEPSASLAAQIKDLLPDLRAVCGEDTTPVLCFDRGGWSPDLFADIIAAGFGLLTYRKNQAGKDIPDLDDDAFAVMTWTGDDGRDRSYDLADTTIEVPVTSGTHKGETLTLRQVTRRDKGRQVHILTTIGTSQLPAPGVVCRMTGRWREENWFRYGRAHFALDSLDSYAVTPDDPARMVPNPAKKTAAAAVKAARKDPRRRRDRPPAQAGRAAQPRARQPDRDHQRDARQAGRPRRRRPPQPRKPPRPKPRRPRRRSRCASTTRTWSGSKPRPS